MSEPETELTPQGAASELHQFASEWLERSRKEVEALIEKQRNSLVQQGGAVFRGIADAYSWKQEQPTIPLEGRKVPLENHLARLLNMDTNRILLAAKELRQRHEGSS